VKVLQTFLRDEDPGLARTMSALDRELAKGERALGLLENLCTLATCGGRRRDRPRAADDVPPEPHPSDPYPAGTGPDAPQPA